MIWYSNFMTGKTHQILGISSGLAAYFSQAPAEYNPATLGAVFVVSYFAALLPDIDQPAAKIWQSFPLGHVAGRIIDPFFEHRNLSHSILGAAGFTIGAFYLFTSLPDYWGLNSKLLALAFSVSYLSHLLADLVTVEGIPLFFPFSKMQGFPPKPFDGLRVLTGKWFENLIIFPLVNLGLILIIVLNLSKIKAILFK